MSYPHPQHPQPYGAHPQPYQQPYQAQHAYPQQPYAQGYAPQPYGYQQPYPPQPHVTVSRSGLSRGTHWFHAILTVSTGGLWGIIWLLHAGMAGKTTTHQHY